MNEVIKQAIQSLAKKPEYLLLFGIVLVFSFVAKELPEIVSLPLLLVSIVASITIVFMVLKREENEEYMSRLKTDISDIKEGILLKTDLREKNGIIQIYTNRKIYFEESLVKDLERKITEIKQKDKNAKLKLQIIGISLRDFFIEDFRQNYPRLNELIDSYLENDLKIEALVIDTENNKQAEIRARSDCYKSSRSCESRLFKDLKDVANFYKSWKNKKCLEIRKYQASAACFMIIFDDEYVVIEQYHSGGFGGKIPLIKYDLKSDTGKSFQDQGYW